MPEGLFSNYSIKKLTAMLNEYNNRVACKAYNELKRIEKALEENQYNDSEKKQI